MKDTNGEGARGYLHSYDRENSFDGVDVRNVVIVVPKHHVIVSVRSLAQDEMMDGKRTTESSEQGK